MWPDNETDIDLLGFRVHVELVRSVVTDAKQLPVTIGIFADWGGGKSSLMKLLEKSLDPEIWPAGSAERARCEKIACLYFNGWLFEGYDDAKSAILTSVLLALGEHMRFGPKIRDKVVSLLKSVNWMRVARLGFKHVAVPAFGAFASGGATLVPGLLGAVPGSVDLPWGKKESSGDKEGEKTPAKESGIKDSEWEDLIKKDESSGSMMDVRSFRVKFSNLLKECKIESLVILIDDLDRCSPERIIENLEAIKLFLNVENTAFVIGADKRIVQHAIEWRYNQDGGGPALDDDTRVAITKDYLEKLIQVPYRLPRLSPSEIESYMTLLFCHSHLGEEESRSCRAACEQQREANRYGTFGYGAVKDHLKDKVPAPLADALAFCASSAPLITECLKGNPRQVKRFLNALQLRKKLAEIAKLTNVEDAALVKLMILEYSQEKLFFELFGWQATQNGQPKELAALERQVRQAGKGDEEVEAPKDIDQLWSTTLVRRWLVMEPALANIDLRDYFWVARDRLESTLGNVSMVPPLVRRVFEGLISDNAGETGPAVRSAQGFKEDALAALLGLMEQKVKTKPAEKSGYAALRLLAEGGVGAAAKTLADILTSRPLEPMPAAVGVEIMTLVTKKPELKGMLQPAIDRLLTSNTRIGKAAQGAQPTSGARRKGH
jgi:KAP family P-loop domain